MSSAISMIPAPVMPVISAQTSQRRELPRSMLSPGNSRSRMRARRSPATARNPLRGHPREVARIGHRRPLATPLNHGASRPVSKSTRCRGLEHRSQGQPKPPNTLGIFVACLRRRYTTTLNRGRRRGISQADAVRPVRTALLVLSRSPSFDAYVLVQAVEEPSEALDLVVGEPLS